MHIRIPFVYMCCRQSAVAWADMQLQALLNQLHGHGQTVCNCKPFLSFQITGSTFVNFVATNEASAQTRKWSRAKTPTFDVVLPAGHATEYN